MEHISTDKFRACLKNRDLHGALKQNSLMYQEEFETYEKLLELKKEVERVKDYRLAEVVNREVKILETDLEMLFNFGLILQKGKRLQKLESENADYVERKKSAEVILGLSNENDKLEASMAVLRMENRNIQQKNVGGK